MPDLDTHARWRLNVAIDLARKLRTFDGIQAIVVGGSVARGYADHYSDLELPIFWDRAPDDTARHGIMSTLDATLMGDYDGPSGEDNLVIDGLQVDFWHNTVAAEDAVIDAVLRRHSTDLGDSNFMDTVRWCIPLRGTEIIEGWKRRAREYPDALAERHIRENLAYLETHVRVQRLELDDARDNPTLFYEHIAEIQRRIFLILLAVNRAYFPTFKWMYHSLDALSIKPHDIVERLRAAFDAPHDGAIADTNRLVHETFALLDRHHPEIDTSATTEAIARRRIAHDGPIHLD